MKYNQTQTGNLRKLPGFTLIELLVVISIIGVLAAFTIPVLKKLKEAQYKKVARAELDTLQTALENYKAKYGSYPPSSQKTAAPNYAPAMYSQLFYELSGTTANGGYYTTLDGRISLPMGSVTTAYGTAGFVNCTHGSAEDGVQARNFLPDLKPTQYNAYVTNNGIGTAELVTSVGGPDQDYLPLGPGSSGVNPIRYVYPGTHNPGSYDLWIQLKIGGRTNLICNWSREVQINSPLP